MYEKSIIRDKEKVKDAEKKYADCLAERSYCDGRKDNVKLW